MPSHYTSIGFETLQFKVNSDKEIMKPSFIDQLTEVLHSLLPGLIWQYIVICKHSSVSRCELFVSYYW